MRLLLLIAVLGLAACNTTMGTGCITYGQHRSDVPPSPEFAVLDTAMTEACNP